MLNRLHANPRGSGQPAETAAVVIPVYKASVDAHETVSLKQGFAVLRNHPFVLVCPAKLDVGVYCRLAADCGVELRVERFPPNYFNGIAGYNGLMMSTAFYRRFSTYAYILIYQTDAYVFRDELAYWCERGFDYIGAPIFEGGYDAAPDAKFLRIGNGGFSLRKVQSHLRALQAFAFLFGIALALKQFLRAPSVAGAREVLQSLSGKHHPFHRFNGYPINEDDFWGCRVPRYCRWFRTPDPATALAFSVETLPERFIRSEKDLPFGCHAWWKYREEFWRPYLAGPGC